MTITEPILNQCITGTCIFSNHKYSAWNRTAYKPTTRVSESGVDVIFEQIKENSIPNLGPQELGSLLVGDPKTFLIPHINAHLFSHLIILSSSVIRGP
jgi:hypothetical protein